MLLFRKQLVDRSVANDTDKVVAYCPLPAQCELQKVWLDCHVRATGVQLINYVTLYGMSGFVVPIADPDAVVDPDTAWDTQIPKDADWAAGGYDIDTAATDAAPEFEPGEGDMLKLFGDQGTDIREIYRRRKILTAANCPVTVETSTKFLPVDHWKSQVKRNHTARRNSYVLFGFSSPANVDDVTAWTNTGIPAERDWNQLRYAEQLLENVWASINGLGAEGASGASLPYNEALDTLERFLEPDNMVDAIADTIALTLQCTVYATYQINVPGRMGAKALGSG